MERTTRQAGNAVMGVVLVLLVVAALLGGNYVRNYRIEQEDQKDRPYARYSQKDLEVLAAGYRMAVASSKKRYHPQRVQTQQRYGLGDQIKEFERVQKAAAKARDKALDVAGVQKDLDEIEKELSRRAAEGDLSVHLARMFRMDF
jgi:hypothetical protein